MIIAKLVMQWISCMLTHWYWYEYAHFIYEGAGTHSLRKLHLCLCDASSWICYDQKEQWRMSWCKILWRKWVCSPFLEQYYIMNDFNFSAAILFKSLHAESCSSNWFTREGKMWFCRYIDMAETLCQKRALEAFRLDPAKWGGKSV